MIRTDGLGMVYRRVPVLRGLTIELAPGEVYGLIGPNGAAKTTTLRILATLLSPTSGEAWIGGQSVTAAADRVRPLIGYMPDEPGPYQEMTVAGHLGFFAAAYKIPRAERAGVVGGILELAELRAIESERVEELSRGMQQRLSLARALIHDPKVLLLDEPAAGLDPRGRLEMREMLRELSAMGKTILIASHLLAELAQICGRLGLLDRGQLLFEGTLAEAQSKVSPAGSLELEVTDRTAEAERLLGGAPQVLEVSREGERLMVRLAEGARAAELARALIEAGFELRRLVERTPDLEDVYLALTGGSTDPSASSSSP